MPMYVWMYGCVDRNVDAMMYARYGTARLLLPKQLPVDHSLSLLLQLLVDAVLSFAGFAWVITTATAMPIARTSTGKGT